MKTRLKTTSAVGMSLRGVAGAALGANILFIPISAMAAGVDGNRQALAPEPAPSRPPAGSASTPPPAILNPDSGTSAGPGTPDAAPSFYAAAFVATTLVYRPYGGSFLGPQGDATPIVGFGYFVTAQVALELDLGATFASGAYVSTSLTPGVVWAFHPNVYAAGRVIVPVHPDLNVALYPGVGGTYAFGPLSPFLELNVLSTIGRGEPDLGLGGSAGALYSF